MLVMFRMNHEFMEYMRTSYPDTPLSEFKVVDVYVRSRGGVDTLDDDEDDEQVFEMRKKMSTSERLMSFFYFIMNQESDELTRTDFDGIQ